MNYEAAAERMRSMGRASQVPHEVMAHNNDLAAVKSIVDAVFSLEGEKP